MTSPLTLQSAVGIGDTGQTSSGTTQATARVCLTDHVIITDVSASGAGVILKPANGGEAFSVGNGDSADTLLVYPPVGASFNNTAANTPLSLPPQRAAYFVFVSPTQINAIY